MSKEYYDGNTNVSLFALGEKVCRGTSAKLSPPWAGPFEIISVDGVNIILRLPRNKALKVHSNRLNPFFELQEWIANCGWPACYL